MDTIPEEGWSGKLVEKTMAHRLSVFEEEFPGVSADQAAVDRGLTKRGAMRSAVVY